MKGRTGAQFHFSLCSVTAHLDEAAFFPLGHENNIFKNDYLLTSFELLHRKLMCKPNTQFAKFVSSTGA